MGNGRFRRFLIWIAVEGVVVFVATFVDAFVWAWYPLAFYALAVLLWVAGMAYIFQPWRTSDD